jgi:hypothetical protein
VHGSGPGGPGPCGAPGLSRSHSVSGHALPVLRDTIDTVSENRECIRIVGSVPVDDDTMIWIDHVFTRGASPDDDPGYVGLTVTEDDASAERARLGAKATCLLTAAEALLLADRLQRAAHLVLETEEDLPDPEREYRRYRGSEEGLPGQPV